MKKSDILPHRIKKAPEGAFAILVVVMLMFF